MYEMGPLAVRQGVAYEKEIRSYIRQRTGYKQFKQTPIMDKETEKMIESIKVRVAEVLINLNLIESKISDIIARYINSEKDDFIRKVLLSSLIVNFSSKLNVLKYILRSEKIDPPKDFFKAIAIIMTKRNVLAHSDSLLNIEADVVDVDFDWNHDGTYMYPIYGPEEPCLPVINDGTINYENISKIIDDFSKYFEIAKSGLESIEEQIIPKEEKKETRESRESRHGKPDDRGTLY